MTAAKTAGKFVYCEWPLGNGLAEAVEMSERARKSGVCGAVGLQARSAPLVNNVRDLVRDGYVGEVLSTTLIGSVRGWGAETDRSSSYLVDARNGATLLTIPFGHTVDALCYRLENDLRDGTNSCPTFDDAVQLHRLLAAIEETAATGKRRSLARNNRNSPETSWLHYRSSIWSVSPKQIFNKPDP